MRMSTIESPVTDKNKRLTPLKLDQNLMNSMKLRQQDPSNEKSHDASYGRMITTDNRRFETLASQ